MDRQTDAQMDGRQVGRFLVGFTKGYYKLPSIHKTPHPITIHSTLPLK